MSDGVRSENRLGLAHFARCLLRGRVGAALRLACVLLSVAFAAADASADDIAAADRRGFADGLMSRGMYRLALPEYKALSEAKPAPADLDLVLARLAECQRQTGDNRAAAATCERIEREYPSSPSRFNAAITHALALGALGDAKRSSRIFDIISADAGAERDLKCYALYFAGENYFKSGEYDAARSRLGILLSSADYQGVPAAIRELKDFASLYLAEMESKQGGADAAEKALASYAKTASSASSARAAAEALYKGATLAYTAGKFDEAVARYSVLLSKYPSDIRVADALLPAAWANFKAGRFAEASGLAERHSRLEGLKPDAAAESAYLRAAALARLSRSDEALEAFAKLISAYPSSHFAVNAKYERLVLLFKAGRHSDVLAEAAAFANPPTEVAPDLLWLQAESAEALGDAGRAMQFYTMLAQRHASSPLASESLYRSARHLREKKAWLDAVKSYQKLVLEHKDSPLVPYALYESGCCNLEAGRLEDALRDYDAMLEGSPDHKLAPDALLQKSTALHRLGRMRDAGIALDALLSKHPGSAAASSARFQRARVFYEGGDYKEAENALRSLLAAGPSAETRQEASFLLGLSLAAQGRDADAAGVLQPLMAQAIRDKIPLERLVWLADFQFSRGKYAETAEIASEILGRETTPAVSQAANVLLARSKAALGDKDAAAAAFKAAADSPVRSAYSSEAALRYGEMALEMSDKVPLPEAERYLRLAIELAASDGQAPIRTLAYRRLGQARERVSDRDGAIRLYLAVSLLYQDGDAVRDSMDAAERLLREAGRIEEAESVRQDRENRFNKKP